MRCPFAQLKGGCRGRKPGRGSHGSRGTPIRQILTGRGLRGLRRITGRGSLGFFYVGLRRPRIKHMCTFRGCFALDRVAGRSRKHQNLVSIPVAGCRPNESVTAWAFPPCLPTSKKWRPSVRRWLTLARGGSVVATTRGDPKCQAKTAGVGRSSSTWSPTTRRAERCWTGWQSRRWTRSPRPPSRWTRRRVRRAAGRLSDASGGLETVDWPEHVRQAGEQCRDPATLYGFFD